MSDDRFPTIADRIIAKCGGVSAVAQITGQSESWVYRWTYDKAKGGTGGLVPRSAQVALLAAAREGKVDIGPADFFEGAA
jgi:predicted DNA-binding transcriptional regulator AlpA